VWSKVRYRDNVQANIAIRIRASVGQALRRCKSDKSATLERLVGCSKDMLLAHLESTFLPGMSWRLGNEIEIDHIRPLASFDLRDPLQQSQAFYYTNLQMLWKADNRAKGSLWGGLRHRTKGNKLCETSAIS
jgi:hypothetical protein